jgi:hypothetical protein
VALEWVQRPRGGGGGGAQEDLARERGTIAALEQGEVTLAARLSTTKDVDVVCTGEGGPLRISGANQRAALAKKEGRVVEREGILYTAKEGLEGCVTAL